MSSIRRDIPSTIAYFIQPYKVVTPSHKQQTRTKTDLEEIDYEHPIRYHRWGELGPLLIPIYVWSENPWKHDPRRAAVWYQIPENTPLGPLRYDADAPWKVGLDDRYGVGSLEYRPGIRGSGSRWNPHNIMMSAKTNYKFGAQRVWPLIWHTGAGYRYSKII